MLMDINWNNISGLFFRSPVLLMTYIDSDVLVAMSHQHVWDAELPESYHPHCCLAMVKLFINSSVYALVM